MIVLMALAFRVFVRKRLIAAARKQAGKGLTGSMEGHAAMDMSVTSGGSWCQRLFSRDGYTAVSHIFVMEWAAVIRDAVIGLLIAGGRGRLGAQLLPAAPVPHQPAAGRQAVGAAHRPGYLGAQLRLLDRQRAADNRESPGQTKINMSRGVRPYSGERRPDQDRHDRPPIRARAPAQGPAARLRAGQLRCGEGTEAPVRGAADSPPLRVVLRGTVLRKHIRQLPAHPHTQIRCRG